MCLKNGQKSLVQKDDVCLSLLASPSLLKVHFSQSANMCNYTLALGQTKKSMAGHALWSQEATGEEPACSSRAAACRLP